MQKIQVARIEIQPESRCPISCIGCQHASPQRPRESPDASAYLPHLATLWRWCSWGSIFVGGGEPFLRRDLAGFIADVHRGPWGGRRCDVITNGYWLVRDGWRAVAAPVLALVKTLIVSRYPIYVDRLGVAEWDARLDALRAEFPRVTISSFHDGDPADLKFAQNGYHGEPKPIATPNPCMMKYCFQLLPDGRLSKCPLGRGLDSIPNATEEFRAEYRASSYYDLSRGGEGFAEFVTPEAHPACGLCGIGTGDLWTIPWASDPRVRTARGDEYLKLIGASPS